MAKDRFELTPSTRAKLRKALSEFAAGHEQSSKVAAAAVATLAGVFTSRQVRLGLGRVRVTDLNELLAAHRAEQGRFERELLDKADLLLREITPPQQKTSRRKLRDRFKAVVDEVWPSGVPEAASNKELLDQLGKELKQRGIRVPEDNTTMLRSLGRRPDRPRQR